MFIGLLFVAFAVFFGLIVINNNLLAVFKIFKIFFKNKGDDNNNDYEVDSHGVFKIEFVFHKNTFKYREL